jgi:hypothetical protein
VAVGFLEETSKELRFNVGKNRTQRKFGDKNGELVPVRMDDKKLPYGFLAEVTQLEVDGISMQMSVSPESEVLQLSEYEGMEIAVQGHDGGDWIYQANIVDKAGPITSMLVKTVFQGSKEYRV